MKQNVSTAILVVILSASSFPIQGEDAQDLSLTLEKAPVVTDIENDTTSIEGEEAKDLSPLLEEVRRSMRLPQAVVTDIENGTTSIDGINFFLLKGRFPETVDGVIIARKSALRHHIGLVVNDDKGNLLLTCSLNADSWKEGISIFFFTLNKQLASGAFLTFSPSKGLYQLQLNTVVPREETVLKFKLKEVLERISRMEEK